MEALWEPGLRMQADRLEVDLELAFGVGFYLADKEESPSDVFQETSRTGMSVGGGADARFNQDKLSS